MILLNHLTNDVSLYTVLDHCNDLIFRRKWDNDRLIFPSPFRFVPTPRGTDEGSSRCAQGIRTLRFRHFGENLVRSSIKRLRKAKESPNFQRNPSEKSRRGPTYHPVWYKNKYFCSGRVGLELTLAEADYWRIRGEVSTQNMSPVLVEAFNR